jgi:U3 small nucleolar RNA-associated protein 12
LLISSSKDTLIKVWDLSVKACVETLVEHPCEVLKMTVLQKQSILITGSSDSDLRIYKFNMDYSNAREQASSNVRALEFLGVVTRKSRARVVDMQLFIDASQALLGVAGADKSCELFRALSAEDIERKRSRKMKRLREKGTTMDHLESSSLTILPIELVSSFQCDSKIRSFAFGKSNKQGLEVGNNFGKIYCSM